MVEERIPALRNFQVSEGFTPDRKPAGLHPVGGRLDGSRRGNEMGGAKDRWLGRAFSRTLLLLFVALIAAVAGAVPGDPAGAAKKATMPPGDPPGNNGTVKIDQSDVPDDDKGNEPIGDNCSFWLKFYNFDQGQLADITFAAHPPTGGKDAVTDKGNGFGQPGDGWEISDDPAGGGTDEDAVLAYNLTDYVRGLDPHPQQGYHIKLTITVRNADGSAVPGGVKHKVFWIKCSPPAAPSSQAASTLRIAKAQEGAGEGPFGFELRCTHSPLDRTFTLKAGEKLDVTDVPPGTTCVVKETDAKGAQSTTITEDPPHGKADDGEVKTTAEKSTIVTFKNKFPGTEVIAAPPGNDIRPPAATPAGSGGNPGTAVLGATETAPDSAATLPRTGNDAQPLTVAGLCLVTAGGMALLAGRRVRRV
jgi:LPXTG-motif cell wall-anchored protein